MKPHDKELIDLIWNEVFELFDSEPDLSTELCGRLAQAAADAVEIKLCQELDEPIDRHARKRIKDMVSGDWVRAATAEKQGNSCCALC